MLAITPFNEFNQTLRITLGGAGYTLSLRWTGEVWLFSASLGDQKVVENATVTPAARLLPVVEGGAQITCMTDDFTRNATEDIGSNAWEEGWRLWHLSPEEAEAWNG